MNQKSRWELKYEKIKNGSIDSEIEKLAGAKKELTDRIVEAYKNGKSDEVNALQGQIQRIDQETKKCNDSKNAVKTNEPKIQNILQLKEDLVKESSNLLEKQNKAKEYAGAKKQVEASDKKLATIETEIEAIDTQIKALNQTIQNPNTSEADRKKAEQDKAKLNAQRQQKNNEIGKLNSEEYTKSRTRMQELENEVGTYDLKAIKNALAKNEKLIAKCDLIGTNLVNGKSMEEITANLKNFKFKHDKNFSQKIATMRDEYKKEKNQKVVESRTNSISAVTAEKKAYDELIEAVKKSDEAVKKYEAMSNLPAKKTAWYQKIPGIKQIYNGISKIFNKNQTIKLDEAKKAAEEAEKAAEEAEKAARKAAEEYKVKKAEKEKLEKTTKSIETPRSTEYLEELRGQKNEDEVLKGMAVYGDTFRDKLKYTVPNVKSSVTQGEVDKAKSKTKYVMNNKDPKNPDHTTDKRAYNVEARKAQVKANIEQIRKMKEEKSGSER